MRCEECQKRITFDISSVENISTSLIKGLSGGRLQYFSYDVVDIVLVSCLVVNDIVELDDFFPGVLSANACSHLNIGRFQIKEVSISPICMLE